MNRPRKKRKTKNLTKKVGQIPGNLIYTGVKRNIPTEIQFLAYDKNSVLFNKKSAHNDFLKTLDKENVNWIHISSLENVELIGETGSLFNIHPLMLEDCLNTEHLPKVEFSDDHVFIILKILSVNEDKHVEQEHVSFILGNYYLLSLQEQESSLFDSIKERILNGIGKVRNKKADYLFYLLIDIIVDNYFLVLEDIRKSIERTEDLLVDSPSQNYIHEIHHMKKQLLFVKKYIYALRDAVNNLINEEPEQFYQLNYKYFRDVQDHVNHIFGLVESYLEDIKALGDLNNSNMNNSMNQVMKILTIVATIFIPLTFIAGIYGMNFKYIPELEYRWGYFAVWGLMLVVSSLMIWFMKRKKWF